MIGLLLKYFPVVFRQIARICGIPFKLAQSAVAVIVVPNGTVATNGTITLGTALPTTYSGGAWIRLPAGAIVGGAAGLYWCIFSSTTVGVVKTLFVDPAAAFTPYVPTVALVTATGSNAAYTQTFAALTVANVTLPGGFLGDNGGLEYFYAVQNGGSTTGVKSAEIKLGAGQIHFNSNALAALAALTGVGQVRNRGSQSVQYAPRLNASTSAPFYGASDTATDKTIAILMAVAAGTEYSVLESFAFKVIPG